MPMQLAVDRPLYGVIVDAIIKCGRELEALRAEAEMERKAKSKSRARQAAETPALAET
jgi:hypothetical protein